MTYSDAICSLSFEDPLTFDCFHALFRSFDFPPSVVLDEGVIFLLYCLLPQACVLRCHGLFVCARIRCDVQTIYVVDRCVCICVCV